LGKEQIGWVEGYGMLSRDNGTLVYTQTKEKATWQRAGFQNRTMTAKEKGDMKGNNQRGTRIPGSHARFTYTRKTTSHVRIASICIHPRPL
jgi:hypothetical protein